MKRRFKLLQRLAALTSTLSFFTRRLLQHQEELLRTPFDITLLWSAISRLFLVSSLIYSLKDAAERDRLTGSTFIQLNCIIGVWALIGMYVKDSVRSVEGKTTPIERTNIFDHYPFGTVGVGQAIVNLGTALNRVEMFLFAVVFLIKGYKGHHFRREGRLQHTVDPPNDKDGDGEDDKE